MGDAVKHPSSNQSHGMRPIIGICNAILLCIVLWALIIGFIHWL
jgi:hypothetical protein